MASATEPEEPAHDVLAAEEFVLPAPDPVLHRGPVVLPPDPAGTEEPHDVLAAEEFALPAGPTRHGLGTPPARRGDASARVLAAGLALVALALLRRR
jgi:hypothetical protein